jgi:hypothetical protein
MTDKSRSKQHPSRRKKIDGYVGASSAVLECRSCAIGSVLASKIGLADRSRRRTKKQSLGVGASLLIVDFSRPKSAIRPIEFVISRYPVQSRVSAPLNQ